MGAAITPEGVPFRAVSSILSSGQLALSMAVWSEWSDVFHRPRLARLIRPDARTDLLAALSAAARWFEAAVSVHDCRDAKDNKYLELALAAQAQVIVSSDGDLLALHPWRGVRILRPADYLLAGDVRPPESAPG